MTRACGGETPQTEVSLCLIFARNIHTVTKSMLIKWGARHTVRPKTPTGRNLGYVSADGWITLKSILMKYGIRKSNGLNSLKKNSPIVNSCEHHKKFCSGIEAVRSGM
jgi:hypothetical protein